MLLIVQDGQGNEQTVIVKGQETVIDYSGVIAVTGSPQLALVANGLRSGWLLQNNGQNPMAINEIGNSPGTNSFFVAPFGGTFPPDNFPLTVAQINIMGTAGDAYTLRAW